MTDTACKTNSKGRPLGFVNSVDGENKSILTLVSLLQSERLGAFHFILTCLGFMHEKHTQCISVFLSDSDGQTPIATKELITTGLLNPKNKYRGYHHYGFTHV